MDGDDNMSKPSAFFVVEDLYQQVEELGLRSKIPAQTKLTLDGEGLGLRWSTGTQDEPTKKKSCVVKAKAKVVKHTLGPIFEHRKEFKRSLTMKDLKQANKEKVKAEKENDDPNATNKNKKQNLTPPFVVDLMTQEGFDEQESILSPSHCSTATNLGGWEAGGWTNTPRNWIRLFQARSTEGGADFYVDRSALGEVALSLFREVTSEKSAAKKSG
jgi:hypothetical protein